MADLDPALVELASRKIARSVYAKIVGPEFVERYVDANWQNHKASATDAILSLGIPAAALNALAKGEAVVVPKVRTREMITATPFLEDSWDAQLAASPYRSDT